MLSITIESFGPFASRYEVRIKPLTLIIGRNSTGKSMIAYLIWSLATATPDFNTLFKVFEEEGGRKYAQELLKSLEAKDSQRAREVLEEILMILVERAMPPSLAQTLQKLLPKVYGRRLGRIVAKGRESAFVEVRSGVAEGGLRFTINAREETVEAEASGRFDRAVKRFVDLLANADREKGVLLVGGETWSAERLRTVVDLYGELSKLLGMMMGSMFIPPMFATREAAVLLIDSRAGVLRTLLRPFTAMLSEALFPDQTFVAYYYLLAERLATAKDELSAAKKFMDELGFNLELHIEGGVYSIYVRMWSGEVLPVTLAPSGVRESVALVAALVTSGPPTLVVVEEPEAHLHPRAQILLAELMARAASRGKWIVATTHSDYILYEVNNQVIASKRKGEGIAPDNVAVYLVRREDGESVIEPLSVGPEGVSEDEFARVAEELAVRRSLLTLEHH